MSEAASLQVNINESGPVTRTLTVEVPSDRVEAARSQIVADLRRRSRIPGFRPGKAPVQVIEKNHGADIASATAEQLVRDSLDEAISSYEGRILNVSRIDPEPLVSSAPFKYSATLEVPPDVKLKSYKKLKVERPTKDVDDEAIDRVLDNLRNNAAEYREPGADDTIVEGDHVAITYNITRDGQTIKDGNVNHRHVMVGDGSLAQAIEDKLIGARSGDTLNFEMQMDESAPTEALQGATVQVELSIEEHQQRHLPELGDEFAARMLPDSDLAGLRDRIRDDLAETYERESRAAVESQVLEQLLDNHEFDVPEGVVARAQQNLAEETAQRLVQQGYPESALKDMVPMLMADAAERADRNVRIEFLLEAISEAEGIEISDDQIMEQLNTVASASGKSPEALAARAREDGTFEQVRHELRNRKALDQVVEYANIKDVTPEAFQKSREKAAKKKSGSKPDE